MPASCTTQTPAAGATATERATAEDLVDQPMVSQPHLHCRLLHAPDSCIVVAAKHVASIVLTQAEWSTHTPHVCVYSPGNEASAKSICAQGKNLSTYIASGDSWKLVASTDLNSLYPSYGYESTTPGSPLVLEVDTTTPDNRQPGVVISYTRAMSNMGMAQIR